MQLSPGKLMGMKRLSDENGIFKMTAVDQRPPIKKPIEDFLKVREAPWNEVARFKKMLVENLQDKSSALLLDPHFAIPFSLDVLNPRKGLVVTLEDSGFVETKEGSGLTEGSLYIAKYNNQSTIEYSELIFICATVQYEGKKGNYTEQDAVKPFNNYLSEMNLLFFQGFYKSIFLRQLNVMILFFN